MGNTSSSTTRASGAPSQTLSPIDTPRASPTFVASALLLILVSAAVQYWSCSRAKSKFPPGPTPLPIIGNILDIPRNNPWKTFAEWGKIYGM